MIKKVLVVGGAGYIGGGVTDLLLEKNIPFAVYDNLTYENHYLKPVEFIYGDIRDRRKLVQILPDYSHVIWLAALVGDPVCAIDPQLTKEINQDTIGWLSKNFEGRILFTSTCSVYGASDQPVNEQSATNPLSAYAQSKLASEQYLENKNALIFRLGTAYGVSDTYSRLRMDLAINYMTMNAIRRGFLEVFGGSQWRPFIHVLDIGRFLVENLDTEYIGIFNLATENLTIIDVAKKIQSITGCEVRTADKKFEDNRNYNASTEKATKAGILPEKGTRDVLYGISQIRDIVKQQRVNNLDSEVYSNAKYMVGILKDYQNNMVNK